MENGNNTEQEIIDRLAFIENANNEEPNENEDAEFDKLHNPVGHCAGGHHHCDKVIYMFLNKLFDILFLAHKIRTSTR